MECVCGHMPWDHRTLGACDVCLKCGRSKPGPGKECCLTPKRCPCTNFQKEPTMTDQLRDAATRAAVWGVISDAAKTRQNEAKAELAAIEPGDTIAAKVGAVIDDQGELVPGVELVAGEPYVTVRKEKDSSVIVAELLAGGRVALDGIKELGA